MSTPLRLLAVHAHPDDESSKGAATLARYAAEGVDVLVATCTGGERGDLLNPAADRPEVRADLARFARRRWPPQGPCSACGSGSWASSTPDCPPTAPSCPPTRFATRDRALRAHTTQADPAHPFFAHSREIERRAWPTEDYELAQARVPVSLPEDDLFAGLR
jgi:LmbE family N-acetylglucosaminyl deacetylase